MPTCGKGDLGVRNSFPLDIGQDIIHAQVRVFPVSAIGSRHSCRWAVWKGACRFARCLPTIWPEDSSALGVGYDRVAGDRRVCPPQLLQLGSHSSAPMSAGAMDRESRKSADSARPAGLFPCSMFNADRNFTRHSCCVVVQRSRWCSRPSTYRLGRPMEHSGPILRLFTGSPCWTYSYDGLRHRGGGRGHGRVPRFSRKPGGRTSYRRALNSAKSMWAKAHTVYRPKALSTPPPPHRQSIGRGDGA
jgi:hypothetical protein